MVELIFQEVWSEQKSISICYITMFSVLQNQVNVTDIENKSSVSFFSLLLNYTEKFRSCRSRQNHYITCKNKHRSTKMLEEILLDLNHHIAS